MSVAGFGYACAVAIAMLFFASAWTKARDIRSTARGFAALGIVHAGRAARIVPAIEVTIAVALVGAPPIGGAGAVMTIAFFTTFLATRLRAGVRAPCACFGAASQAPLSVEKLVDNGFIFLAAIAAVACPRPTVPSAVDVVALGAFIAISRGTHLAVARSQPGL